MIINIILAVVASAYIAVIVWLATRRREDIGRDRSAKSSEGISYLDALLGCAKCPNIEACHGYIEEHKTDPSWDRNFCPKSTFILELTGR